MYQQNGSPPAGYPASQPSPTSPYPAAQPAYPAAQPAYPPQAGFPPPEGINALTIGPRAVARPPGAPPSKPYQPVIPINYNRTIVPANATPTLGPKAVARPPDPPTTGIPPADDQQSYQPGAACDYGNTPAYIVCPGCNLQVTTNISHKNGCLQWLSCCCISLLGGVLGCCLIPFFVDRCMDTVHKCPYCGQWVGEHSRPKCCRKCRGRKTREDPSIRIL